MCVPAGPTPNPVQGLGVADRSVRSGATPEGCDPTDVYLVSKCCWVAQAKTAASWGGL